MAFIGFENDYKQYQEKKQQENIVGTGNKIAYDDMPDISAEDLKIITQSRHRHDCFTVYMQSDIGFYDDHYNTEDDIEDLPIERELYEQVKAIRRIYKNYFAFNDALTLRDKYIDALIEKYGGEEMFGIYAKSGAIKEWLPPMPVYSKSSPDYKYFLEGKFNIPADWDDDKIEEVMAEYIREFEETHNIDDVEIEGDVLVSPILLQQLNAIEPKSGISRSPNYGNGFGGVTTYDVQAMSDLVRSWIDPSESSIKPTTIKSTNQYFGLTEKAIKERYYKDAPISTNDLAEAIRKGHYDEPEEDMNEMVVDPVSKRPMTRAEYESREFVRALVADGWNELRLMRKLGIGSNYELQRMEQKRRRRKKATKTASSFISDLTGYDVDQVCSLDELDEVLFND